MSDKFTAEDLEWEEPAPSRSAGGGEVERLVNLIASMRSALTTRRGEWAVLATFTKPAQASSFANAVNKRRQKGDSRLTGIEVAGRKLLDGGSKIYVRAVAK